MFIEKTQSKPHAPRMPVTTFVSHEQTMGDYENTSCVAPVAEESRRSTRKRSRHPDDVADRNVAPMTQLTFGDITLDAGYRQSMPPFYTARQIIRTYHGKNRDHPSQEEWFEIQNEALTTTDSGDSWHASDSSEQGSEVEESVDETLTDDEEEAVTESDTCSSDDDDSSDADADDTDGSHKDGAINADLDASSDGSHEDGAMEAEANVIKADPESDATEAGDNILHSN